MMETRGVHPAIVSGPCWHDATSDLSRCADQSLDMKRKDPGPDLGGGGILPGMVAHLFIPRSS